MNLSHRLHALPAVALLPLLLFSDPASSQEAANAGETRRSTLPLDVAVSLHRHHSDAPVNLSPDGEWIAHTVKTDETVPRGTSTRYSDTGVPFSHGNARMEATLSSTTGGKEVVLGGPESSSWSPAWSPDGTRVAFYSDEGGEAGLWIWKRETGERRRVSDAVVRPFLAYETPRWSQDGDRLLVKLLPAGRTLAEANALSPTPTAEPAGREMRPGEPSVRVRRSAAAEEATEAAGDGGAEPSENPVDRTTRVWAADLALVDVETGKVRRLVEDTQVRSYAFSPDGSRVAYAVWTGWDEVDQKNVFDLRVMELETGDVTTLGEGLRLGSIGFGHEWSWSPDGRRLAWVAGGDVNVASVPSGQTRTVGEEVPGVRPSPPIWSPEGDRLLAVAGGALWAITPESGEGRELGSVDGWSVDNLITPSYLSPVAWRSGGQLWVTTSERGGRRSGVYSVDPSRGEVRPRLRQGKSFGGTRSLAASEASDEIVFAASGLREPGDLWLFDTGTDSVRRGSSINDALLDYELGTARRIHWRGTDGRKLSGALLLPPGWDEAREPVPLVVFVYGGARGSRAVDRFGLTGLGPAFNMHVLATRGYAVLYPDAPLRTGRTIDDLVATVLPGVNAAIEQGYADPERLALMGQSFGAINVVGLLTETDRFGAALISAAVTHPDLLAQYLESPGYFESGQGDMGGTIWEHPDRYRANSPLLDFPRIETPILMAQGEEDGLDASDAIFTALDRLDKHVEYRIYEGEEHVVTRPANVIDLWERRLTFLGEHLDLSVGPEDRETPSAEGPTAPKDSSTSRLE